LSREQNEESYGADLGDFDKVVAFTNDHELAVVCIIVAKRNVLLSGNAERFSKAFGIEIGNFEPECGAYRLRNCPVTVPESFGDAVENAHGIDNRPAAKPL
jgi:hypothetical protein